MGFRCLTSFFKNFKRGFEYRRCPPIVSRSSVLHPSMSYISPEKTRHPYVSQNMFEGAEESIDEFETEGIGKIGHDIEMIRFEAVGNGIERRRILNGANRLFIQ